MTRTDELLVALEREVRVLDALKTDEYTPFDVLVSELGYPFGRSVTGRTLRRLLRKGKVQVRKDRDGVLVEDAWRKQPTKPLRCPECGRPYDTQTVSGAEDGMRANGGSAKGKRQLQGEPRRGMRP